jgi:hypothetical protein
MSSLYTWAVYRHGLHMETSSREILHPVLWQARVGRETERFKREREEEMGKERGKSS